MGSLLRLALFILAFCALAAGTGALLLGERHRERAIERLLVDRHGDAAGPLIAKIREHHSRTQSSLLLFGGGALACFILLAAVPARTPNAVEAAPVRTGLRGLETLARATAAQRIELDQERETRHRAEENLSLQQLLANRALQDKIRLGRDLHDGLVQTLYATGLVLETATQRLAGHAASGLAAGEAVRLIDRAKSALNAAIRQARAAIDDLQPDTLEHQEFPVAVGALLDHLDGDRLRERVVNLSPVLPAFAEPTRTELLQIIRESVSNALRHGAASRIEIDFTPLADSRPRLIIRDNGGGFDPAAVTRGHGLDNLAARARALQASLDIDAQPGVGTTITLTLPCPQTA